MVCEHNSSRMSSFDRGIADPMQRWDAAEALFNEFMATYDINETETNSLSASSALFFRLCTKCRCLRIRKVPIFNHGLTLDLVFADTGFTHQLLRTYREWMRRG